MFTKDDIIDLGPDDKITSPGLYRLPLQQHHDQPADGPSVTSSTLRTLSMHGPSKVWATSKLNPYRYPRDDKTAFRLGRAMHCIVEGGWDAVAREFNIFPEDTPKRPTPAQRKAVAEGRGSDAAIRSVSFWDWVEDQEAAGKSFLSDAETTMIAEMGAVIAQTEVAVALLQGLPEITMAAKDDETGLWLLARPDVLTFDGLISDYKKTSTQGRAFDSRHCDRTIMNHRYDMQLEFAADVYKRLTGADPDSLAVIFQEDKPPFDVLVRGIDSDARYYAAAENERARHLFAHCLETGKWPHPEDQIGTFRVPEWYAERMSNDLDRDGKLPGPRGTFDPVESQADGVTDAS